MKKVLFSTLLLLSGVGLQAQKASPQQTILDGTFMNAASKERMVLISTDFGDIKLKLYDATPQHRDNFIKLAEKGFYDSLLFHRIIKGFMIQGGDPQSKNAAAGVQLGSGDVGYTIPAEFNDSLFHKKGTLCAARMENPQKASSGCQFYIVQGKQVTDGELEQMEHRCNDGFRQQNVFYEIINRPENAATKEKFAKFQQANQQDSLSQLVNSSIVPLMQAEMKPFKYSDRQRELYKTIGGTPMLDQGYTVFGEVVEGLDVVDKIAAVQTAPGDRPLKDVRMKMKVIQ